MDTPVSRRAVHIVLAYALTVVDVGVTLCVIWGWLLGRSLRYLATLFAVLLSKVIVTAYYARGSYWNTLATQAFHPLVEASFERPRDLLPLDKDAPSQASRVPPRSTPFSRTVRAARLALVLSYGYEDILRRSSASASSPTTSRESSGTYHLPSRRNRRPREEMLDLLELAAMLYNQAPQQDLISSSQAAPSPDISPGDIAGTLVNDVSHTGTLGDKPSGFRPRLSSFLGNPISITPRTARATGADDAGISNNLDADRVVTELDRERQDLTIALAAAVLASREKAGIRAPQDQDTAASRSVSATAVPPPTAPTRTTHSRSTSATARNLASTLELVTSPSIPVVNDRFEAARVPEAASLPRVDSESGANGTTPQGDDLVHRSNPTHPVSSAAIVNADLRRSAVQAEEGRISVTAEAIRPYAISLRQHSAASTTHDTPICVVAVAPPSAPAPAPAPAPSSTPISAVPPTPVSSSQTSRTRLFFSKVFRRSLERAAAEAQRFAPTEKQTPPVTASGPALSGFSTSLPFDSVPPAPQPQLEPTTWNEATPQISHGEVARVRVRMPSAPAYLAESSTDAQDKAREHVVGQGRSSGSFRILRRITSRPSVRAVVVEGDDAEPQAIPLVVIPTSLVAPNRTLATVSTPVLDSSMPSEKTLASACTPSSIPTTATRYSSEAGSDTNWRERQPSARSLPPERGAWPRMAERDTPTRDLAGPADSPTPLGRRDSARSTRERLPGLRRDSEGDGSPSVSGGEAAAGRYGNGFDYDRRAGSGSWRGAGDSSRPNAPYFQGSDGPMRRRTQSTPVGVNVDGEGRYPALWKATTLERVGSAKRLFPGSALKRMRMLERVRVGSESPVESATEKWVTSSGGRHQ